MIQTHAFIGLCTQYMKHLINASYVTCQAPCRLYTKDFNTHSNTFPHILKSSKFMEMILWAKMIPFNTNGNKATTTRQKLQRLITKFPLILPRGAARGRTPPS